MAFAIGETGVLDEDAAGEVLFKDGDKLGGERYFWEEENGGFAGFHLLFGEFEVDAGLAGTGDAVEEAGGRGYLRYLVDGFFLRRIQRNS